MAWSSYRRDLGSIRIIGTVHRQYRHQLLFKVIDPVDVSFRPIVQRNILTKELKVSKNE